LLPGSLTGCRRTGCRLTQLKGKQGYNAAQPRTFTRDNVQMEAGWVATSSKRQDWLFAQDDRDMSAEGKQNYAKLNRLGKLHANVCQSRVAFSVVLVYAQVWTSMTSI
jgi:hypothetical protein